MLSASESTHVVRRLVVLWGTVGPNIRKPSTCRPARVATAMTAHFPGVVLTRAGTAIVPIVVVPSLVLAVVITVARGRGLVRLAEKRQRRATNIPNSAGYTVA